MFHKNTGQNDSNDNENDENENGCYCLSHDYKIGMTYH